MFTYEIKENIFALIKRNVDGQTLNLFVTNMWPDGELFSSNQDAETWAISKIAALNENKPLLEKFSKSAL
jgi:hypothetical protein